MLITIEALVVLSIFSMNASLLSIIFLPTNVHTVNLPSHLIVFRVISIKWSCFLRKVLWKAFWFRQQPSKPPESKPFCCHLLTYLYFFISTTERRWMQICIFCSGKICIICLVMVVKIFRKNISKHEIAVSYMYI